MKKDKKTIEKEIKAWFEQSFSMFECVAGYTLTKERNEKNLKWLKNESKKKSTLFGLALSNFFYKIYDIQRNFLLSENLEKEAEDLDYHIDTMCKIHMMKTLYGYEYAYENIAKCMCSIDTLPSIFSSPEDVRKADDDFDIKIAKILVAKPHKFFNVVKVMTDVFIEEMLTEKNNDKK